MEEILCSIHNYTKFSGGSFSFYDMAQSALSCGLDAVFTTDKNIYPVGHTQFYFLDGKRTLFVCGEELFDPAAENKNHYLSLGIDREQFNRKTANPQDEIRVQITNNRENNQSRHIELINAQEILQLGLSAGQKKIQENIQYFDKLLQTEQRYIGLAGTCSSADMGRYTYPELFSTACNHLLSEEKLSGDFIHDKLLILKGLKLGNLYIALDGLADARGFRFSAEVSNHDSVAYPGDTIFLKNSITLKISCPDICTCRLIRNGAVIKEWYQCKQVPYTIYEPGYYRVACALLIRKNLYDWIFSNPVYVVKG